MNLKTDRLLEPLNAATRNDLMEIIDDRYEQSATIIISQLPIDQWYEAIGDNTLADAILHRLMHNAHRINLKPCAKKLIP
jgi:DNA replication protein DnaC